MGVVPLDAAVKMLGELGTGGEGWEAGTLSRERVDIDIFVIVIVNMLVFIKLGIRSA